jgi:hypothetical protein
LMIVYPSHNINQPSHSLLSPPVNKRENKTFVHFLHGGSF